MIKDKNIDPAANIATSKIAGTLASKTLTSATLTGTTVIGTGATITAPAIVGATVTGTVTIANGSTITTPAITAPAITGATTIGTGATITTPTMTYDNQTLAGAGSVQGDAAAITVKTPGVVIATGANGTVGVRLPAAAAGAVVHLKNNAAAVLKVWPVTGNAINALGANNSISMASLTSATFIAQDITTWFTIPLLPS